MVVLSLILKPRVSRIVNIVVSLLYVITIFGAAVGETWAYYLLGSFVEVILLAAIARTAWTWPPPQIAPPIPQSRDPARRTLETLVDDSHRDQGDAEVPDLPEQPMELGLVRDGTAQARRASGRRGARRPESGSQRARFGRGAGS
jgi:hypothetical protein